VLALATPPAIPAIAPAVSVELLVVRASTSSVFATLLTVIAMVTVLAMLSRRALVVLPIFSCGALLRLASLSRGFRDGRWRGRRRRRWCVLGRD
jgi:hypothetical protein